jgi:prophage regulatory protein
MLATAPASLQIDSTDRLLSIAEVMRATSLRRSTVYKHVRNRTFPAPLKLGRRSAWASSEISEFIRRKQAARNALSAVKP